MSKKILLMSFIAILGVTTVLASKIDGKWKATVEASFGVLEMEYTFKAEGEKLTGSLMMPNGEMPIKNGKIQGDNISFDLDMMGNLMPVKGKIVGETIEIVFENAMEGDGKIVLEKVKTE